MVKHFSECIGLSLEEAVQYLENPQDLNSQGTFVVDLTNKVIDVLIGNGRLNLWSLNEFNQKEQDERAGKKVNYFQQNLVQNYGGFHPVRHFNKIGDTDFRYLIPLDLLED